MPYDPTAMDVANEAWADALHMISFIGDSGRRDPEEQEKIRAESKQKSWELLAAKHS